MRMSGIRRASTAALRSTAYRSSFRSPIPSQSQRSRQLFRLPIRFSVAQEAHSLDVARYLDIDVRHLQNPAFVRGNISREKRLYIRTYLHFYPARLISLTAHGFSKRPFPVCGNSSTVSALPYIALSSGSHCLNS